MSNESQERGSEPLLEPLAAYKTYYAAAFRACCDRCLDGLTERSGVNAEENRLTVKEYDAARKKVADLEGTLAKYRRGKRLLTALIVLGGVLSAFSVLLACVSDLIWLCLLPVGVAMIVTGALVRSKKIAPLLKQGEEKKGELERKAEELLRKAWEQTAPLNALFEDTLTRRLIREAVPPIVLDDRFEMRRYDYLNGKYGYGKYDDPESSVLGVLTGEIAGNPFVVERQLIHAMGVQVYTGSITIHWTTTRTDANGRLVTDHHSQTLTASVTKPKPFYRTETRLIYGNEAAPDLHFSRSPAHAEDLSEKERERKVKKGAKHIRKKQEEAMEAGGGFTEMGNAEFDVLFGALDRDNEVQFRLLFTPLAQRNLLALIKDEEGYGDDFRMVKDGCLNYIYSEHSAGWDMNETRTRYASYSVDLIRRNFLEFNEQYFRSLYFDLAPLLSVPLYQQQKPREYLYGEDYPRAFPRPETEFAVNRMDPACFAPPTASTASLLKTNFLSREGKSDVVRVTANAYETYSRVDYVTELGGDGLMHEIPVPWVEYIPVSSTRVVKLKEIGLSDRDFYAEATGGKYRAAMQKYGQMHGYGHGILCCVVDDSDASFDETFEPQ